MVIACVPGCGYTSLALMLSRYSCASAGVRHRMLSTTLSHSSSVSSLNFMFCALSQRFIMSRLLLSPRPVSSGRGYARQFFFSSDFGLDVVSDLGLRSVVTFSSSICSHTATRLPARTICGKILVEGHDAETR